MGDDHACRLAVRREEQLQAPVEFGIVECLWRQVEELLDASKACAMAVAFCSSASVWLLIPDVVA
jgi:hypothetical protein